MRRLLVVAIIGLAVAGCNCSLTEPQYRCSKAGIVEFRAPGEWNWQPVSGSAIVRCDPDQPVNPDNLR